MFDSRYRISQLARFYWLCCGSTDTVIIRWFKQSSLSEDNIFLQSFHDAQKNLIVVITTIRFFCKDKVLFSLWNDCEVLICFTRPRFADSNGKMISFVFYVLTYSTSPNHEIRVRLRTRTHVSQSYVARPRPINFYLFPSGNFATAS